MNSYHVGKVSCFSSSCKWKFQIRQLHKAKYVSQSCLPPPHIFAVGCWSWAQLYWFIGSSFSTFEVKMWPSAFLSCAQIKTKECGGTLGNYYCYYFYLCYHFTIQSPFFMAVTFSLMADLSGSALFLLQKLSVFTWKVVGKGCCANSSTRSFKIHSFREAIDSSA